MLFKRMVAKMVFFLCNGVIRHVPFWFIRRIMYSSMGMKLGRGAYIASGVYVVLPWRISIGPNSTINPMVYLDGRGTLKIGQNTSVSLGVVILTATHDCHDYRFTYLKERVTISDNVWIGVNSTILSGVSIDRDVVVAANSLVNKDLSANGIYAGSPAKIVKNRY